MLVERGAIRKVGKSFAVGTAGTSGGSSGSRPVVLVVAATAGRWVGLARSPRTKAFAAELDREARRCGVQPVLTVLSLSGSASTSTPDHLPGGGAEEIARYARSLGTRYRGALLALSRKEVDDFDHLAGSLIALQAPVVWFDRYGEYARRPRAQKCKLTVCAFSEQSAIDVAVAYLRDRGHKEIAYHATASTGWQSARLAGIRRRAVVIAPDMTIHAFLAKGSVRPGLEILRSTTPRLPGPVRQALDYARAHNGEWLEMHGPQVDRAASDDPHAGFLAWVAAYKKDRPRPLPHDRILEVLLGAARLAVCFQHPGITAILSANDMVARAYTLPFLSNLRYRVPKNVSLVSFDSALGEELFPLTSIDFGFGDLGYRAFHRILGDVPGTADRRGDIILTQASVSERGTVAPA
jgi:DNA-binding LacI/PurR family transcriptional regulator